MSIFLRNGLIIGLTLGMFMAWSNWPPGAVATDARIVRTIGQVIGTTLVMVLVALMIGRMNKR